MVTLLRVVGGLNLVGGVVGAVWYWGAFSTVQEATADSLGVPMIELASTPWAIAGTLGILVGGFVSFVVFMALAEILESCQETTTGIALLRKRQHQLEQAADGIAASS